MRAELSERAGSRSATMVITVAGCSFHRTAATSSTRCAWPVFSLTVAPYDTTGYARDLAVTGKQRLIAPLAQSDDDQPNTQSTPHRHPQPSRSDVHHPAPPRCLPLAAWFRAWHTAHPPGGPEKRINSTAF